MVNRSIELYNDIKRTIKKLEIRQCMCLGIMGMARTITLVKYISLHHNFESLLKFETYISGGIKKVLYDDLTVEKDIDYGINICNSLIPILEEYDYSDCCNKQDEDLMSIAYSLVEEWYYFIGLLSLKMENDKCRQIGCFLSTPCNLIDSYLHNKYEYIDNTRGIHNKINEEFILERESVNIQEDIKFISDCDISQSFSIIEKRLYNYLQYKIWEK